MSPAEKITCIIVDDEAPARQVVAKYLEDYPSVQILAECKNAFEALEALNTHSPDLIFLDINMPKLSGLNFLKTLKNPPLVIIATAYREYAIEGFELDVVDYLNKPFSPERFMKALQKARECLARKQPVQPVTISAEEPTPKDDFIFIKEDKKVVRVDLRDILFLESVGDYVKVHTIRKTIMTYMTLKKMAELLDGKHFPRIHKSYIVNITRIASIEANRVIIGDASLPVGESYRANFMQLVDGFMAGKK